MQARQCGFRHGVTPHRLWQYRAVGMRGVRTVRYDQIWGEQCTLVATTCVTWLDNEVWHAAPKTSAVRQISLLKST